MRRPPKPAVRSREECDILVESNLKLITHMAKKVLKRIPSLRYIMDIDDLTQEGYFTLLRAAELWEEGRGVKFSTYACQSIFNGLSRGASQTLRKISSFNKISLDWGKWDGEIVARDLPDILINQDVSRVWSLLPLRSRFVVWKVGIENWTYKRTGEKLKITRERVRQIYEESLDWMRRRLDEGYEVPVVGYKDICRRRSGKRVKRKVSGN